MPRPRFRTIKVIFQTSSDFFAGKKLECGKIMPDYNISLIHSAHDRRPQERKRMSAEEVTDAFNMMSSQLQQIRTARSEDGSTPEKLQPWRCCTRHHWSYQERPDKGSFTNEVFQQTVVRIDVHPPRAHADAGLSTQTFSQRELC